MVVGYDAKYMFEQVGGLSHYASLSLEALTMQYPQNHYIIYTPRFENTGLSINKILVQPSVHRKSLHRKSIFDKLCPSRMLFRSTRRHGVQVFHGMFGALPKGIEHTDMAIVLTLGSQLHRHYPCQFSLFKRWKINRTCRRSIKHADALVVMSEFSKQEIMRFYHVDAEKIRVIKPVCEAFFADTVSDEVLRARQMLHNLPEKFILAPGNFDSRHNLQKVVEALPHIPDDIHLVVVGHKNHYYQQMEQLAQKHHVAHRIVRIKEVNPISLPAIYRLASVLCVPSRYECASLSILRAFLTQLPVVAATGSCMEEFGGDAALYFHPDSATQLADAVIRATGDERESLLQAAKAQNQKFTSERLAQELETLYREVRAQKQHE